MPTQSKSANGAKAKAKAPVAEKNQARTVAETAVDLPVGAVLAVADRVTELVEPFADRTGAEKQLKSYRSELRRRVKRTERRGTSARRRATAEARRTLKRNRDEIEQRVRKLLPV